MMAVNVFAAETEDEAQYHFSTLIQAFIGIITNNRGLIPKPKENLEVPAQIAPHVQAMLQGSAVGSPEQVAERLSAFQEQLRPDEYIISMPFYDHAARLKSMELTMSIQEKIKTLAKVA